MPHGEYRLHCSEGYVPAWEELCGGGKSAGAGFPFLGVRVISINDGYDSNAYIRQTGGIDVAFKNLVYNLYSRDLSHKVKVLWRQ